MTLAHKYSVQSQFNPKQFLADRSTKYFETIKGVTKGSFFTTDYANFSDIIANKFWFLHAWKLPEFYKFQRNQQHFTLLNGWYLYRWLLVDCYQFAFCDYPFPRKVLNLKLWKHSLKAVFLLEENVKDSWVSLGKILSKKL